MPFSPLFPCIFLNCGLAFNISLLCLQVSIPRFFFDSKGQELGDRWWALQEVDEDSEVTGQVCLRIQLVSSGLNFNAMVSVDEGASFKSAELYCTVQLEEGQAQSEIIRTPPSKKTPEPVWHFLTRFSLPTLLSADQESLKWVDNIPAKVHVCAWALKTGSSDVFMGRVTQQIQAEHLVGAMGGGVDGRYANA